MVGTKWFIFVFVCLALSIFCLVYLSETRYVHERPVFIFSVKDGWASTSNGFYRVTSSAPPKARKWCMIEVLKPRFDAYSYIKDFYCFEGFGEYLRVRQKKR